MQSVTRSRAGRVARRATALLLVLCLGLFAAETPVAELHDGEAAANHPASVESAAPHSHGNVPSGPAGGMGHSTHVCHCVHSHSGLTVAVGTLSVAPLHASAPRVRGARVPSSLEREPQLRPPIS